MSDLKKKVAADESDKIVIDVSWWLFDKSLLTFGVNLDKPTPLVGRIHWMIKLGLCFDHDVEGFGEDDDVTFLRTDMSHSRCW